MADEPAWCDPQQCTAHERIPDRPAPWFAHRSTASIVDGPTGQAVIQLVQPATDTGPHLYVAVKPHTTGGVAVQLELAGAAAWAAALLGVLKLAGVDLAGGF